MRNHFSGHERCAPGTILPRAGESRRSGAALDVSFRGMILVLLAVAAGGWLPARAQTVGEADAGVETAATLAQHREFEALMQRIHAAAEGQVKSALSRVKAADPRSLSQALGAGPAESKSEASEIPDGDLQDLGDLDADGAPELLFKWARAARFPLRNSDFDNLLPDWTLFLLSWDGAAWRAFRLMDGNGLSDAEVLPRLGGAPALAVIEGISLSPYPVIFRVGKQAAVLAWDSRGEESLFQSYAGGSVLFRDVEGVTDPVLVATGKADPGFLVFPRAGGRGFLALSVYTWDGAAYVPRRTEYTENQDFVLYRFISALHLHDYRGAYALVDPSRFMQEGKASPESFQKYVEANLPEFLENNIFEVRGGSGDASLGFPFELRRNGTTYVYHPAFSNGPKYLLTGLRREKE